MHWDTFKRDNYDTVGGDGGCRVCEVRAALLPPHAQTQGFLATVTVRDRLLLGNLASVLQ